MIESKDLAEEAKKLSHTTTNLPSAADGRRRVDALQLELDGRRFEVRVAHDEAPHAALARARREREPGRGLGQGAADAVVSPMQGTVLDVRVADGDEVRAGDVVCIVEAMKMENEIAAHRPGVVSGLAVAPGEAVTLGQLICHVAAEAAAE